jgi:hypothetical protein
MVGGPPIIDIIVLQLMGGIASLGLKIFVDYKIKVIVSTGYDLKRKLKTS